MSGEPGRLTRAEQRAVTRARLLDAAAEAFTDHGFEGASIDDIAARAGFTRGAFYSNFEDKTELLIQLCDRQIEAFTVEQLPDVLAQSPRERLGTVSQWLAAQDPPLEVLLAVELARLRDRGEEVAGTLERVLTSVLSAVEELVGIEGSSLAQLPPEDRAARSRAILAAVTGASLLRHLGIDGGQRTLELLLAGVIDPTDGGA